jgi:hypothetical protein
MKLLVLTLTLFLIGCDDSSSYPINTASKVISKDYCLGGKELLKYDYLQGDPTLDSLIGKNVCYYKEHDPSNVRISKVEKYDYLQGDPALDSLIGEDTFYWGHSELKIIKKDFLSGIPDNDFVIGKDVYRYNN